LEDGTERTVFAVAKERKALVVAGQSVESVGGYRCSRIGQSAFRITCSVVLPRMSSRMCV
jgi:hypothetical protein